MQQSKKILIEVPSYFQNQQALQAYFNKFIKGNLNLQPKEIKIQHPIAINLQKHQTNDYVFNQILLRNKLTNQTKLVYKVVGKAQYKYSYQNLQDFYYQHPLKQKQIIDSFRLNKKLALDQNKIKRSFKPPSYLKKYNLQPSKIYYHQQQQGEEIKKYKRKRFPRARYSFLSSQIPKQPQFKFAYNQTLYQILKQAFDRRPIWLKNAILNFLREQNIEYQKSHLQQCLYSLSYNFKDGPWKQAYIRYGYNPKQQTNALLYQTVSININQKQFLYQLQQPNKLYDPTLVQKPQQSIRKIYQLCDICNQQIKHRLQIQVNKSDFNKRCDKKFGWLDKRSYFKIIRQIKSLI